MLTTYKKLWQLLDEQERRQAILLLIMIIFMSLLQMVGVASIMPFMSVAANPDVIKTNAHLALAYAWLGFTDPQRFLFVLGLGVFIALVVSIAVKAITFYAQIRFSEMRNYRFSCKLMEGYLCQPYEWFLNRHSADLGKSILSESEKIVYGTLTPAIQLISEGLVFVAIVMLLLIVDPLLAITVATSIGGIYALIYVTLRKHLNTVGAQRLQANHLRFKAVQESFGSIKDVKVNGIERVLMKGFREPAAQYAYSQAALSVAVQMPRFALEVLAFGGLLAVVLYLMTVSDGLAQALPILAVYAFGAYRLMPALQSLYGQSVALRFAGPALDAFHRECIQLAREDSTPLWNKGVSPLGLRQSIQLEGITYAYPSTELPSVKDLGLTIPARSTFGVVGKTGSGKTTTVDIILGLLRPQSGMLIVDGTPITSDNLRAWQASIGYVPQHIYLSDSSITSNIAFGVESDSIDRQAVEHAARIANLHDFITRELPQGYETNVGERGVRLSGGQRQRVGIARALYHNPDLLILDEATSALDNVTEKAVMDAIHNLDKSKTIIMIAHRLSTVRECDQILLLANGQIKGIGAYEELAENSSHFGELVESAN